MVLLGIGWLIWSIIVWSKGQTPAKAIMKMRCVDAETGQVATMGAMVMRELLAKGLLGSITFGITTIVGAVMVLGESRRALWDNIAKTVVVDDPTDSLAP